MYRFLSRRWLITRVLDSWKAVLWRRLGERRMLKWWIILGRYKRAWTCSIELFWLLWNILLSNWNQRRLSLEQDKTTSIYDWKLEILPNRWRLSKDPLLSKINLESSLPWGSEIQWFKLRMCKESCMLRWSHLEISRSWFCYSILLLWRLKVASKWSWETLSKLDTSLCSWKDRMEARMWRFEQLLWSRLLLQSISTLNRRCRFFWERLSLRCCIKRKFRQKSLVQYLFQWRL